MKRWLLLANCQTFGLTNSINLMSLDCDVVGIDIWDYKQHLDHYNRSLALYDRIVIHPEIMAVQGGDLSGALQLDVLPALHFEGYHPDICFAEYGGEVLKGPLQDYQSMIALAAYRNGFGVAETVPLYNGRIYERCGYFEAWPTARKQLFDECSRYGLELQDAFSNWGRRQAFMYSTNHPRIEAIYDVAKLFLRRLGLHVHETDLRPADNLSNGPCYPVYPELGEALGVEGSLLFKRIGQYRYLTLEQYVQASFELLDRYPADRLGFGGYQARYEHVEAVVRGEA